jgi:hypothetical protein
VDERQWETNGRWTVMGLVEVKAIDGGSGFALAGSGPVTNGPEPAAPDPAVAVTGVPADAMAGPRDEDVDEGVGSEDGE